MQTISDYTIYCTKEQTKKAIELGARIEHYCPSEHERVFIHPTAEQIIGWLEGQKIYVHIDPYSAICCRWYISSRGYSRYGYTSDVRSCKSRKEATLAAIDSALGYLESQQRKERKIIMVTR